MSPTQIYSINNIRVNNREGDIATTASTPTKILTKQRHRPTKIITRYLPDATPTPVVKTKIQTENAMTDLPTT